MSKSDPAKEAKQSWEQNVPPGSNVGGQPGLRNTKALYQNMAGKAELSPAQGKTKVSDSPSSAQFHGKTGKAHDTGGVV